MILIELIEARRNLRYRCKELFTDEKIAEQIYRYLCEGLDECEDKKHAYFFQGWAWNNSNITQHTECVENALDEDYGTLHGKWVMNERGVYECSICGQVPTAEEKQYDRYCSWCGAKMDK